MPSVDSTLDNRHSSDLSKESVSVLSAEEKELTSWGQESSHVSTNETLSQPRMEDTTAFWRDQESSDGQRSDMSARLFRDSSSCESIHVETEETSATAAAPVSADNERQILLLMLLAQVCALHDPTPRTFTVHVLELFERGILDRESIRFLFDLGLVPNRAPPALEAPPPPPQPMDACHAEARSSSSSSSLERVTAMVRSPRSELEPARAVVADPIHLRAQEASAIRTHLAQQDTLKPYERITASESSWEVEHHPLSLSRYQREFRQVRLLNSGAFGHVYHATNKMEGRDYAIKRVAFSVQGYSNESVTQVVREVRCLAQCDHPNCVRYYTSWLEPSWMTGSGTTAVDPTTTTRVQRRLLSDVQQMVMHGGLPVNSTLEAPPSLKQHSRRYSFDGSCCDSYDDSTAGSDYSEWTIGAKDDSCIGNRSWQKASSAKRPNLARNTATPAYRYQICLYIQMQLCHPSTLADWIRQRNQSDSTPESRKRPAIHIFSQLVKGIAHVHGKGILHRDLKPANIFAAEDGQFKIGDFGLSKLLRTANGGQDFDFSETIPPAPLLLPPPQINDAGAAASWQEPLTAGIGTASYAATEQIDSRTYGPEADIFSLGLILLELMCSFGTEHERILTFRDCRRGTLPSWIEEQYPPIASLILACTHSDPKKRPAASALLTSHVLTDQDMLRSQLEEKDQVLEQQRTVIAEKDRIIEELRRQMEQMTQQQPFGPPNEEMLVVETINLGVVESTSFTDDEDY